MYDFFRSRESESGVEFTSLQGEPSTERAIDQLHRLLDQDRDVTLDEMSERLDVPRRHVRQLLRQLREPETPLAGLLLVKTEGQYRLLNRAVRHVETILYRYLFPAETTLGVIEHGKGHPNTSDMDFAVPSHTSARLLSQICSSKQAKFPAPPRYETPLH